MTRRFPQFLLILSLVLVATGCYVYARPAPGLAFAVSVAPPALQADVAFAAPGPGFAWVDGYYDWSAGRKAYVWIPGRWMRPPFRSARWYPPRWERGARGNLYYRGYWR
jgi:hypothetical protein